MNRSRAVMLRRVIVQMRVDKRRADRGSLKRSRQPHRNQLPNHPALLGGPQDKVKAGTAAAIRNVISGVALLVAHPTKALTNPVFYLKLSLIAVALVILKAVRWRAFTGDVLSGTVKILATASLVCWAGATIAGRLLAYTYTRLDALAVVTR